MLKQGYEETTIRQICREAGIAIGTFYTYFSTKSDLLKSLYEVSDSYFTPCIQLILVSVRRQVYMKSLLRSL